MAKEYKNKKGQKVRFIRVNGRVVPIKDKDPSKAKLAKNYKRHGDGANQASRIDEKYDRKARSSRGAKATGAAAYVSAAVAGVGYGMKNKFAFRGGVASLVASGIAHSLIVRGNRKKLEKSRQREYVRTFGMDSEGRRPSKTRKGTSF